ncbi:MAG: FAD-dependent thymidylate synthase [Proteobacteria bacterium]|nr:FAD-dependent thymidylate synthase [Pseudomonadota bacterium]
MILVNSNHTIESPLDPVGEVDAVGMYRAIEAAGRTCYKSEPRATALMPRRFVKHLVDSGHHSVLEHANVTVRFTCDRGVTHELVRHRLAAYSQESTRYCNYAQDKFGNQLTFVIPHKVGVSPGQYSSRIDLPDGLYSIDDMTWLSLMLQIEATYLALVDGGWAPQDARSILPNCLKTEIVMTANLREWRHVLWLRTSKAAHPDMRALMLPLLKDWASEMPEIFGDIRKDL